MRDEELLKKAVKESAGKIADSDVFVSIFSESYQKDPVCLIQLALSILIDKPIYLLIVKGTKTPKGLIRIAAGYVFCEDGSEESVRIASKILKAKIEKRLDSQ